MLGDNTNNSRDSRRWDANVITTLDGREFIADGNIKLENGRSIRNFDTVDGRYEFLDSTGIKRSIPVEEAEIKRRQLPFVHRSELVGRAFFTFFPVPPFGDFRPRFLP